VRGEGESRLPSLRSGDDITVASGMKVWTWGVLGKCDCCLLPRMLPRGLLGWWGPPFSRDNSLRGGAPHSAAVGDRGRCVVKTNVRSVWSKRPITHMRSIAHYEKVRYGKVRGRCQRLSFGVEGHTFAAHGVEVKEEVIKDSIESCSLMVPT